MLSAGIKGRMLVILGIIFLQKLLILKERAHMEFNKKYIGVLSIGALLGTVGVIAVQTHAQQDPISNPVLATVAQNQAISMPAATSVAAPGDTDNIQDPGNIEKLDTVDTQSQVNDIDAETNDDQGQKQTATTNDKEVQDDVNTTNK